MPTIPETSLSLLASNSSTIWGLLLTGFAAASLYYASPARLTRVLVSALADTEKIYLAAVANCPLELGGSMDFDMAERLSSLQFKVSALREASLHSYLSPLSALCDMFNIRRSISILSCLAEVRELGTQIEISNETQLREINSRPLSNRTMISLRRRDFSVRV